MRIARYILMLLLCGVATAQTVTITLQVTDAGAQTWNNGTWAIQLTSPSGGTTFNIIGTSTPVPNQQQSGALSGSGGASIVLTPNISIAPAGTVWQFAVCPNATSPCFQQSFSLNVTQTLTVVPPAITINMASPQPLFRAYADGELFGQLQGSLYFNVTTLTERIWNGTTWVNVAGVVGLADPGSNGVVKRTAPNTTAIAVSSDIIALWSGTCSISTFLRGDGACATPPGVPTGVALGSDLKSNGVGNPPAYQTTPVIDIRDTPGIDCTGTSDSSTALNTIFGNLRGNKIIIPNGCSLRVNSQVQILNQTNGIIEGEGAIPNQTVAAPSIFGCSGAAGAVLYINRSGFLQIKNIAVYAKGNSCTSNFTQSIRVDNSGVSGFTPTHIWFDGMAVGTSEAGGAITNYVGFNFSGTPNMEQMRITHSDIQCQFSTNSFGAWWNGPNADDGEVSSSGISSCFQAIRVDQGNPRITGNLLGNNGGYTHFGNNNAGAVIFVGSCSSGPMTIIANEQSSGGPFINSGDTAGIGCTRGLNLLSNEMGADDLQNGAFVVNAGTVGGTTFMEGNEINTLHNPNVTGVGSNSQGSSGPLGELIAISNTSDAGLGFVTQKWQAGQLIIPSLETTSPPAISTTSFDQIMYQNQQGSPLGGTGRSASLTFQGGAGDSYSLVNVPQNGSGSSSLVFGHPTPSVAPFFAFDGPIGGIVNSSALVSPGAMLPIIIGGATGSTTWAYVVVGLTGNGTCHTAASPIVSISNGNATLSGSNFNTLEWFPDAGIVYYNIYRTTAGGTPNTTGLLGRVYVTQMQNNLANGNRLMFSDFGGAGDGSTAPATNTCIGNVSAAGQLVSAISTGTAPLVVSSTTNVANLNASTLSGATFQAPGPIGSTTPNSGVFTTVSTATGQVSGVWNCVSVTPVTISTSTTNDQNLMACTIPAGTLNSVGRTLRIHTKSLYTTPAASVATLQFKVKICSVSGCGSGNVATLVNITSTANAGSITNNPVWFDAESTTQTAGAASRSEASGALNINLAASATAAATLFDDTNASTIAGSPSDIDFTAQNFLQITVAFSVASGSNSVTERQLVVDTVN